MRAAPLRIGFEQVDNFMGVRCLLFYSGQALDVGGVIPSRDVFASDQFYESCNKAGLPAQAFARSAS
jgi:hypothetical protein